MHYGEPNLNEGKDWSEMDLFDLKNSLARNTPVAEIADFLCRSEPEVREKIAELEAASGVTGTGGTTVFWNTRSIPRCWSP
jgi:hypothetical protein